MKSEKFKIKRATPAYFAKGFTVVDFWTVHQSVKDARSALLSKRKANIASIATEEDWEVIEKYAFDMIEFRFADIGRAAHELSDRQFRALADRLDQIASDLIDAGGALARKSGIYAEQDALAALVCIVPVAPRETFQELVIDQRIFLTVPELIEF